MWYQESLQWCLRLNLDPGKYLLIYEAGQELANDLEYCFRVFIDKELVFKKKTDKYFILNFQGTVQMNIKNG